MESLERLHSQLDSLEELRTIVKTMKALSAASIRQYEQAVSALAGYYRTVERGLHVVLGGLEIPPAPARHTGEPYHLGVIIFGSDHGLCGRFNEEIATFALKHTDPTLTDPGNCLLLAVGARVAATLERHGQVVHEDLPLPGSATRITTTVQQILLKVDDWRGRAGVHKVLLFYNRHSGGGAYHPTSFELYPVDLHRFRHLEEEAWPSRMLPTFSMDRQRLLARLLRQYLFASIFRACAESQASEHASRLAAMRSAERNLDDHIEEVTTVLCRARQNAITAELLDVVTGFETIIGEQT